jgi:hypothetical protein
MSVNFVLLFLGTALVAIPLAVELELSTISGALVWIGLFMMGVAGLMVPGNVRHR